MKTPAYSCLISAGLLLVSTLASAASSAPLYKITQSIELGAPDRWDYVVYDDASQRVFVAHGDRVTVVNATTGAVIGQVLGFPGGTHGVAIDAADHRGYSDDGKAGMAGSFDLSTLAVSKKLQASDDADAIAFDPSTRHVFVIDGDPGKVTVIDGKTDAVVATINVGEKLEYAVADGSGKLYINGEEKGDIVEVDTRTNQVLAHWPLADCERPHGLAIDAKTHRLFSSCVNSKLDVIDSTNGASVASLPIGRGTDAAAFDPKRGRIFSSNGADGNVTVIQEKDANTFEVVDTIATAVSGRTMAVDPQSGRLFIAAAAYESGPSTAPAPATPPPGGTPPPRRPSIVPGSLKLLFVDPVP